MTRESLLKEIVTVTEMARMCGLSRARFYQLMADGIFPTPSRNEQTGRPFFDRGQQEQCLQIRRTNLGANGKAVMFYGCRPHTTTTRQKRKQLPNSQPDRSRSQQDQVLNELRSGLAQLGVQNIDDTRIRGALTEAYPDGYTGTALPELLQAIFAQLSQEDA